MSILEFAFACLLLIITPGPGVLSVAGVGSGYGFADGSRYLWGLCIGNSVVFCLVATGIAASVFAIPYVREVLLTASLAYLVYLALKVAFAGSEIGFMAAKSAPKLHEGITFQLVNPKAYVANTVLFTGFAFMQNNLLLETAIKFMVWNIVWIPIHYGWLMAGIFLRRMDLPAKVQRAINISMAISMILLVLVALRGVDV